MRDLKQGTNSWLSRTPFSTEFDEHITTVRSFEQVLT